MKLFLMLFFLKRSRFKNYYASVYEKEFDSECMINCRSLSVLEKIVFDADVLNNLDSRFTLSRDGIPSIVLKWLTAPPALPIYILPKESLKLGKVLLFERMLMLFLRMGVIQNLLIVIVDL